VSVGVVQRQGAARLHDLHEGWTLRALAGPVPADLQDRSMPATVPGCVHLDLLAAGAIPDPYLDRNEQQVGWVGETDWRYVTTLTPPDAPPGARIDLVAHGLDTVALLEVDGTEVARTANMHRTHRVDLTSVLGAGPHELAVTFTAGMRAAREAEAVLGERPHIYPHPFNALRKNASNYGWDWGPELVTAGIWRPLQLHVWHTARLASVRPLVDVAGTTGVLSVHVDVERQVGHESADLVAVVEVGERGALVPIPAGTSQASAVVRVPDVRLWWPHGYGHQSRYDVRVRLLAADEVLDAWEGAVGFRSVVLDQTPDERGTAFGLVVNGVPVFARGVNWIPDDALLARVDAPRYEARLREARAAHVNLVRVWGGGTYESPEFYDACDRLGLLVWQDFPFACATYAEEQPLADEVVAEARDAVARLASHPSLVLWCGGNECLWGHEDWDWKQPLAGRTWGHGYWTGVLPAVLAELDPTRPYIPGSPYSPVAGVHPNDPAHGPMHIWDAWNDRPYSAYLEYEPRFVAEFGWQAPPTWATLTRAISDHPLTPESPGMLAHQKAENGNAKLARGLAGVVPANMADWHWATSLVQARALRTGIGHFRALSPHCQGTVWWQLNDCWPVTSWAVLDGDGRRKPAWYALRDAYRPRLLTVQQRAEGLVLVAVNDHAQPWTETVEVTRRTLDGDVLARTEVSLTLGPRQTAVHPLPAALTAPVDAAREMLLAEPPPGSEAGRACRLFVEDADAALPAPCWEGSVEQVPGGYRVHLTARTLLRDLVLQVDRCAPDAVADAALLTLLPGESATIEVTTGSTVDPALLLAPPVLRCSHDVPAGGADAAG
jgi:beta-mannosidase